MINKYETANAIAGYAAPGVYDALKGVLAPPPADDKAAAPAAPAKASLLQFDDFTFDDTVVLQVFGVPVYVNPEIMQLSNTEAATNLNLNGMEIGPDDISVVQKKSSKSKDIDDKEMKDSISGFNLKLAELKKRFKF